MRIACLLLGMILFAYPQTIWADSLSEASCGQDVRCFQEAVRQCRPAGLHVVEQVQSGTLSRQTFWIHHEVLGPSAGVCWLGTRIARMEIWLTEAFWRDMKTRGLSSDQLQGMQERIHAAQSKLDPIFRLPEQRRTQVAPERFYIGTIRDMNRSVLSRTALGGEQPSW